MISYNHDTMVLLLWYHTMISRFPTGICYHCTNTVILKRWYMISYFYDIIPWYNIYYIIVQTMIFLCKVWYHSAIYDMIFQISLWLALPLPLPCWCSSFQDLAWEASVLGSSGSVIRAVSRRQLAKAALEAVTTHYHVTAVALAAWLAWTVTVSQI